MAALNANLDTSLSEQDEYHDALGPEELQELWQLDEKEILRIAGEIGDEWMIIGIHLGYTRAMLSHLEDVYPRQPKWRNFMMIAEWCDVVSHLVVVTSPEEIFKHVKHISFDKPIPKVLGIIDMAVIEHYLGSAYQKRFELNLCGPLEQANNIRAIELQQHSENAMNSGDVWAMDKMKVALSETSLQARDTALWLLLSDLSLEDYYPAKILMSDIQEIKPEQERNEKNLPWFLLNKIVMLNYSAREEDLNNLFEKKIAQNDGNSESDSDDGLFEDNTINYINPMDLFYATFLCCHPILKQDIISKMFACKLAIPFIYTDYNQQLTMSQWALRKILIDKRLNDKILQIDPLNNEIKIVSFLRIGSLSMSKSKIINEILHDKYHPTFYNRDCPLGTTSRKAANGIVEASWFIPSGRENDIFKDIIMVLNLRGDSMHYRKVADIACKLSHVIVVHIDVENLTTEDVKDALLALHYHNCPVIYALESNSEAGVNPAEIWKTYKASVKRFKTQIKVMNLKTPRQTKSSSDITKEMRKFLADSIQDKKTTMLKNLTKNVSIVDEKIIKECSQSKIYAVEVMNEIANLEPTEKERILPLQEDLGRPGVLI
ncbi:unnamed protein product [Mytilus edulis]|uniref:Up-regulator of cell proliferation-like domain-containing protein n=1 Tax=Mytilus edulis TaxID=6550 RepID=A0A8S3QK67_MYTED|nr:unnamed protein product [Mytilus edulis]